MTVSPQPPARLVISLVLALLSVAPLDAAQYWWDADLATSGNQNGSGTWISGGMNWSTASVSTGNTAWVNGSHTASLGATTGYSNNYTGGTLTLGEDITLNRIDKSSWTTAYTIEGNGHSLILSGSNAGFGNNNATALNALIINAQVLGGTGGIQKFNGGTVILAQDNVWEGGTRIFTPYNAGSGTSSVLQIGNGGTTGTLGSGTVTFGTTGSQPSVNAAQSVLAFNRSDSITLTQELASSTSETEVNKGVLRQAGSGTLIVESENTLFTGRIEAVSGILQIGNGSTSGSLSAATSASISSDAVLRFARSDNSLFSAVLSGTGRLVKAGAGILTLAGSTHTFSGITEIETGTLQIANDDAISTASTVAFTGSGILDLNGFGQTLATITVADDITATVVGAGSTLTLGAANFQIGGAGVAASAGLDLSGLSRFVFDGATRSFLVSSTYSAGSGSNLGSGTLLLAGDNQITAATIGVGNAGSGSASNRNSGTLLLGSTNVLTASQFNIGGEFKNEGFVRFSENVTEGSVTLRGPGADERMNILISRHDSNNIAVSESYFDSTGGTLDAMVDTLTMGVNNNRGRSALGRFTMGAGTLDATAIILGQGISSSANTGGLAATPTGTLELDGGLVLVQDLVFADRLAAFQNGTVTGIFNFKNGTVRARTIRGGNGLEGVVRLLNWTAGNLETYDENTDLDMSGVTLQLSETGDRFVHTGNGRTITISGPIIHGETAPATAFTKTGPGTLLLGGTGSSHGGTIRLEEGTLRTLGSDVLSDMASIHFFNDTILDLQDNQDAISTLTVEAGQKATVLGSNGSLTLRGGPTWSIGGDLSNTTTELDMSGLESFVFDSSAADIHLGSLGNRASNEVIVRFASGSNSITAKTFGLATTTHGDTAGQNVSEVYLGAENTIHASTITVGSLKSRTLFQFADGLQNPSLTLRATNGTSSATLIIGRGQSNSVNTDAVMDTSQGTLDALLGTLTLGRNDNTGTQRAYTEGTLTMGAGILDAATIILGQIQGNSTSTDARNYGTGTLTLSGPGTVKAQTIIFSHRTGTGAGAANGFLNLQGGTLRAATIQRGTALAGTAIFNWDGGTLENYDATADLTLSGVDLTLNGGGTRTLHAGIGRSIFIESALVDGTSPGAEAFAKTGAGILHLQSASTYRGRTSVQEGLLLVSNGNGSATGSGAIQVLSGGTLAGTGRLAPAGNAGISNLGGLHAGTPGSASAGLLTLDFASTTGGLDSSGILSFALFANIGDNSGILSASDRLLITGAAAGEVTLSGTLNLQSGNGLDSASFAEGDRWLLIDWSDISGGVPDVQFSNITAPDFELPSDLSWIWEVNQTGLYAVIAVVPEPGRALCLLAGLLMLGLGRRRP